MGMLTKRLVTSSIGCAVVTGLVTPVDWATNRVFNLTEAAIAFVFDLLQLEIIEKGLAPLGADLRGFFHAYPAVPIGAASFAFIYLISNTAIVRPLVMRFLPGAPDFLVRPPPEVDQKATRLPFVGRQNEIRSLRNFIKVDSQSFRWHAVIGPSGAGKTRLAHELLEYLASGSRRRWDVGFVVSSQAPKTEEWWPRRPTAIVVDECWRAEREGWLWPFVDGLIARSASFRHPVRLLMVDTSIPELNPLRESGYLRRTETARWRYGETDGAVSPLALGPLTREELRKLVLESSRSHQVDERTIDDLLRRSEGWPIALVLLLHAQQRADGRFPAVAEVVIERAKEMIALSQELFGSDGPPVLALAAMAGPVSSKWRKQVAPSAGDPIRLAMLFGIVGKLKAGIPALTPGIIAQEVLLRVLSERQQDDDARDLIRLAFEANPGTAAHTVIDLWAERPEVSMAIALEQGLRNERELAPEGDDPYERAEALLMLDRIRAELLSPEAAEDARATIDEALTRLRNAISDTTPTDPVWLERLVSVLDGLARSWPRDEYLQIKFVQSLGTALMHLDARGDWPRFTAMLEKNEHVAKRWPCSNSMQIWRCSTIVVACIRFRHAIRGDAGMPNQTGLNAAGGYLAKALVELSALAEERLDDDVILASYAAAIAEGLEVFAWAKDEPVFRQMLACLERYRSAYPEDPDIALACSHAHRSLFILPKDWRAQAALFAFVERATAKWRSDVSLADARAAAITDYLERLWRSGALEEARERFAELEEIAHIYVGQPEIGTAAIRGAAHVVGVWPGDEGSELVQRALEIVTGAARADSESEDLQLAQAAADTKALAYFARRGDADNWRRSVARLKSVAEHWKGSRRIQEYVARGIAEAFASSHRLGSTHELFELLHWLTSLAQEARGDERLEETCAAAAANGVIRLEERRLAEGMKQSRNLLQDIASRYPANNQIQECAARCGVSFIQMAARTTVA